MKTIFDKEVTDELISRIEKLTDKHSPQWGKMNVNQMVAHMNIWNEWVLGKNELPHKQGFLGKLIGKRMLKRDTRDDSPMARGMPAGKGFTVKEHVQDLPKQKDRWIELVRELSHYQDHYFLHDFYGYMTREQIGIFVYKHSDHHLRQFKV